MADNDTQARKTTEAQLIDRAMRDPAFRQELVADPKAVFQRELGMQVPASVDVQVLQETPSTMYLILPHPLPEVGAELSDAHLENVAGGWSGSECGDSCVYTCGCPGAF